MNWQQLIQTSGYPLVVMSIGLESTGIRRYRQEAIPAPEAAARCRLNIK